MQLKYITERIRERIRKKRKKKANAPINLSTIFFSFFEFQKFRKNFKFQIIFNL